MKSNIANRWRTLALVALLVGLPTGFFGCGGAGDGEFLPLGDTGSGDGGGGSQPPPSAPMPITAEEIAEHPPYATAFEIYNYGTGILANEGDDPAVVDTQIVSFPGATMTRLIFTDIQVGEGSFVEVFSPLTHETFALTRDAATAWVNTTPQFPGDVVEVRFHLAPHSEGSYALYGAFIGVVPTGESTGSEKIGDPSTYAQCGGTDDRVPSTDARAARLNNSCTIWMVGTNGAAISAGHCYVCLAAGFPSVAEFNVPASEPSGALNPSAVRDQYPAVAGLNFIDANGCGNTSCTNPDDWAVCRLGLNSMGETAVSRQGAGFTLDQSNPSPANVRITGFGVDTGAANKTQQTHFGPLVATAGFVPRYQVDTRGANSGSPVIDTGTGNAIGVHICAGCGDDGSGGDSGSNSGTSAAYAPFIAAFAAVGSKAPPSIAGCPSNSTVSCNTNNGSTQTYSVTVTDPDGELILVEFRVDGVLEYSQTVASGGTAPFTHTYSSLGGGGPYVVVATATNATGTQDSCTFDVTVTDNPPTITCPGDITVECTGTSGAVVTFAATASDDCTTSPTVTYVPASGSTFPIGTTPVTATVTDDSGQTDQCSFNVIVEDTTDPIVSAFARRLMLFLPRNGLIDCVLTWSAFDICDDALDNTVTVYSNQADTGAPFTPDAGVVGSSVEIRAEVDLTSPDPGRVYLIAVESTDDAGNTGRRCTWVIVPKTATAQDVVGARNIAVAAETDCEANTLPPGWFVILPTTPLP